MLRFWVLLITPSLLVAAFLTHRDFFLAAFSHQTPLTPETINADYDPTATSGIFNNLEIPVPPQDLALAPQKTNTQILGATTSNKRIEVDLTNQRIYAYEGDKQIYSFLVSTGKWNKTPTGIFQIWTKLRATKMEGGSKALRTYYYLPNVPYTMFFYNDQVPKQKGFGIHGAYWHNNFGQPMSHGCINMKPEEAGQLYSWAHPELRNGKHTAKATDDNPGTTVIIYGTAPKT